MYGLTKLSLLKPNIRFIQKVTICPCALPPGLSLLELAPYNQPP